MLVLELVDDEVEVLEGLAAPALAADEPPLRAVGNVAPAQTSSLASATANSDERGSCMLASTTRQRGPGTRFDRRGKET